MLVGFAAETGSLDRAPEKAERKRVDLLVANDVAEPGSGFGTVTNRVTIVRPGAAPEAWPQLTKVEVAHRLLDRILDIRGEDESMRSTSGSSDDGSRRSRARLGWGLSRPKGYSIVGRTRHPGGCGCIIRA